MPVQHLESLRECGEPGETAVGGVRAPHTRGEAVEAGSVIRPGHPRASKTKLGVSITACVT